MTRLSEKRDVQEQLINHLVGIGYSPSENDFDTCQSEQL